MCLLGVLSVPLYFLCFARLCFICASIISAPNILNGLSVGQENRQENSPVCIKFFDIVQIFHRALGAENFSQALVDPQVCNNFCLRWVRVSGLTYSYCCRIVTELPPAERMSALPCCFGKNTPFIHPFSIVIIFLLALQCSVILF